MPGLPLTLVYAAPAECPPQKALQTAVANLVANESARPLSARVTIRKLGEGYEASITSTGGGTRALRGSTCAEVVEGTSVVLALSITPQSAEAALPPRSVGSPRSHAERASDAASPARLTAAALARGDVGTLPRATLGFGADLGLEHGHWSLRVLGTYWLGRHGALASQPSIGGDFSWWTAGVRGCVASTSAASAGRLRLQLCAGVELGVLSGQGTGLASPRERSTPWGAAEGSADAGWLLSGNLRLLTSVGAAFPFVGRRPFLANGERVHEPSALAARAEIGPEVVF